MYFARAVYSKSYLKTRGHIKNSMQKQKLFSKFESTNWVIALWMGSFPS